MFCAHLQPLPSFSTTPCVTCSRTAALSCPAMIQKQASAYASFCQNSCGDILQCGQALLADLRRNARDCRPARDAHGPHAGYREGQQALHLSPAALPPGAVVCMLSPVQRQWHMGPGLQRKEANNRTPKLEAAWGAPAASRPRNTLQHSALHPPHRFCRWRGGCSPQDLSGTLRSTQEAQRQ